MGKNFALIIKSSLFEGIFIDAKGVCKLCEFGDCGCKKIFLIAIIYIRSLPLFYRISPFPHCFCPEDALIGVETLASFTVDFTYYFLLHIFELNKALRFKWILLA